MRDPILFDPMTGYLGPALEPAHFRGLTRAALVGMWATGVKGAARGRIEG